VVSSYISFIQGKLEEAGTYLPSYTSSHATVTHTNTNHRENAQYRTFTLPINAHTGCIFFVSPSTAVLLHTKPISAGTYHGSRPVSRNDKGKHRINHWENHDIPHSRNRIYFSNPLVVKKTRDITETPTSEEKAHQPP
jgi:hypothetical protein